MRTKQVIIVRKDLKMKNGKFGAQVSHASMAPILALFEKLHKHEYVIDLFNKPVIEDWLFNGSFTKIILAVFSEDELIDIYNRLQSAGINCVLIEDEGRTVFNEPTKTCVGTIPVDEDVVNPITGHLPLY